MDHTRFGYWLAKIALTTLVMAMGFFLLLPGRSSADLSANAPVGLLCEALPEPLGIGIEHPQLSWKLTDTRRGARQTAYEIQVASSLAKLNAGNADVWSSGRIESDQSVNVLYSGSPVGSGLRYYWRVRVWDQAGKVGAFSKPSWWEMGLLSAKDWKAKWISQDLPLTRGDYASNPKWIWAADDNPLTKPTVGKRQFRVTANLSQKPKAATLFVTAKDTVAAWVNGKPVVQESPMSKFQRPRDPWGHFRTVSVDNLDAGANALAVEATIFAPEWKEAPNSAGAVVLLRVEMPNGTVQRFVSGADWKTSTGKVANDWFANGFDDSGWSPSGVASEIGSQPLGTPWLAEPIALFRKEFTAAKAKTLQSARIYSSALGTYQLYLNGRRVGDDVLAPGWTDYHKRLPYQVYDVTSEIKPGANALGAILAGGWYADGLGWLQNRYNFGPPPVRFVAQLELVYTDGSHETISTDQSWKAGPSAIVSADLYNGEVYDASLEQRGWAEPSFADGSWGAVSEMAVPEVPLVAQEFEPIRKHEILKPKTVTNPTPGTYVFDLGQNMVGWARLHVAGKKGTRVRLRFGEVLKPNGELYRENLRTAEATDTYVLSGKGSEVFEPHFTFHGFRYVELTGYPGTPGLGAIEGVVFYTSAPFTANFKTENSMVNQLWSNILWGQRGNFLSVPTDCPQRDERLGWMGDAQVFWRAASFNASLAAFSHKFTTDIRDAQSAEGAYADVSPRVGPTGESVAGWADAGVIIPWTAYIQYRDKRILEENWSAMEKWMDHLRAANPNYLWLQKRGNDYADWLAIGSETPKDLIATAYWAYDASLMARMAHALGKEDEAGKYQELFEDIRKAFQQSFVKSDASVGSGSQTSYVLALHMNLLPPEQRAIAAQKLADDIKDHDFHLTTGFLGTPYLLVELSDSGHSDVAYRLLLQKSFPSWGYMIDHGATTMWERWNGDQKMDDPSMNSFNHYAYGAVAEWLYRYAAGIDENPEDPGFHRIELHPQFGSQRAEFALRDVDARYESPYGRIVSRWKVSGNQLTWNVVIPANTTAQLYFPVLHQAQILEESAPIQRSEQIRFLRTENGVEIYQAGAGSYTFTFAQPDVR